MMKRAVFVSAIALVMVSCGEKKVVYKDPSASVEDRVEDLLGRMTVEEKILQLTQYTLGLNDNDKNVGGETDSLPPEVGSLIYMSDDCAMAVALQKRAVEKTRLGIPVLFGYDVIHGYRTIFPIPLAQASSFDPEMSRRAAQVAAFEATAGGIRWTFSPMVDIARDARWGRIAEGYGEDPYVASRFSAATVRGYQGDDLANPRSMAACLKHFVGYGASEAGRDYVYTEISRQSLWDTYLPSFKAGVEAGCPTLMSAFNDISGTPATANHYTLTEVLRNKWGLDGFVVSDWQAVIQLVSQGMAADEKETAALALNAGLDMDMLDGVYVKYMPELIAEGKVKMKDLDAAVGRVLRLKFRLGLFENPYPVEGETMESCLHAENLALAREAATQSMVLLKNDDGVLPLSKKVKKVALIGPIAADSYEIVGSWRARGKAEETVSILKGLSEDVDVIYAQGCDFEGEDRSGYAKAVAAACAADLVICCLGEKADWSGESASRSDIVLPHIQTGLLAAVAATGKPVVTLLSSGRPLDVREIYPCSKAVLEIWQPGTMTGYAVADILTGRANPSAKLPVTMPRSVGQIPVYYNRRTPARGGDMGRYQDISSEPMHYFGYGLSYSKFDYSPVTFDGKTARVTVTNSSAVDGAETVLWFIRDVACSITRPCRELKYFEKAVIKAGESREFCFEIDPERDLAFVDADGNPVLEDGKFLIWASSGLADTDCVEFDYKK